MVLEKMLRRLGQARHWNQWPERAYARERYRQRLATIQACVAEQLQQAPPGPLRLISLCAGDGRDIIDVLRDHPRRNDVTAWCVEIDDHSVALGTARAADAGIESRIRFLREDATAFATYRPIAPADIVMVCGVWGHVPPQDRAPLIDGLQALCRPGGIVIWSRGVHRGIQRLQAIESLFAPPAWERVAGRFSPDGQWAVQVHRHLGPPRAIPPAGHLFHFHPAAGN